MSKEITASSRNGPSKPWKMLALLGVFAVLAVTVSFAEKGGDEPAAEQKKRHELKLRAEALTRLRRGGLLEKLPNPTNFGLERIVAFEENWSFLYLCGVSGEGRVVGQEGGVADDRQVQRPMVVRRIFVLKPYLLVIDDQVRTTEEWRVTWSLDSEAPLHYRQPEIRGAVGDEHFRLRALIPKLGTWSVSGPEREQNGTSYTADLTLENPSERMRLVHLMTFARDGGGESPRWTLGQEQGTLRVEVSVWDQLTARERVVVLWLPQGNVAGKVNIFDRQGYKELPTRPLPSGILPLGETGVRLLERWDIAYRAEGAATWETGRPSSQLKQFLANGTIRPCRAVVLGCGTGTNPISLASRGFDVTGIDIAPTALHLADQKSQKARVKINWLLADVLHPPELQPFDFVFDRGCYHDVRRHHAKAYVAAVRRLARPGAKILILAGNANKDDYWRFEGPPRIKEEEIRSDFAKGFKLLSLREFRFDTAAGDGAGALAWSVLLERNGPP